MKIKDKVTAGLDACIGNDCTRCPYDGEECYGINNMFTRLAGDAKAVIKDQDTIIRILLNRCHALTEDAICDMCAIRFLCKDKRTVKKVGDSHGQTHQTS